jgi:hypothetical protein
MSSDSSKLAQKQHELDGFSELKSSASSLLTIGKDSTSNNQPCRHPTNPHRRSNNNRSSISSNNWEGAGSSFMSCASSFKREVGKESFEPAKLTPRTNSFRRSSFRRLLHGTLLDDDVQTVFTSRASAASDFLSDDMHEFLENISPASADHDVFQPRSCYDQGRHHQGITREHHHWHQKSYRSTELSRC